MAAPRMKGLEHFAIISRDVERSKRFYVDVLGATARERGFPPCVVLAGTTIDFFPATGDETPSPGPEVQHHAFGIGLEEFGAWVGHLKEQGVPIRIDNFGPSRGAILFDDPDGYHLELALHFGSPEEQRQVLGRHGWTPSQRD